MFDRHYFRFWRVPWMLLVFFAGCVALIELLARFYLIPSLVAAQHATSAQRRWLAATSSLLLAIILFLVIAGILLSFRIGRFFFPRPSSFDRPGASRTPDRIS